MQRWTEMDQGTYMFQVWKSIANRYFRNQQIAFKKLIAWLLELVIATLYCNHLKDFF